MCSCSGGGGGVAVETAWLEFMGGHEGVVEEMKGKRKEEKRQNKIEGKRLLFFILFSLSFFEISYVKTIK